MIQTVQIRLARWLNGGNPAMWWLIMAIAVVVTLVRASIAFNVACYDTAIQLEAASRLIQGLGLTSQVFATHSPDISQPSIPHYFTWWPPGWSLLIAGLLALKVPLAIALKLLYVSITLIGWGGWATILSRILTQPVRLGALTLPLQWALAIVLPLFYTPIWPGTDIFMWAGIPFLLLLLFSPVAKSKAFSSIKWQNAAMAGALVGMLYCIRYAALFLILMVFVWIVQQYRRQLWQGIRTYTTFLLACLPFLVAIVLYKSLIAQTAIGLAPTAELSVVLGSENADQVSTLAGLPPYVDLNILTNLGTYAPRLFASIASASVLFGLTNLQGYADRLGSFGYVVSLVILAILCLMPIVLVTLQKNSPINSKPDPINQALCLALASIPALLTLFLAACTLLANYNFLSDIRYYIPATIPTIVSAYAIAVFSSRRLPKYTIILKRVYSGFLILFLLYNILYRPLISVLPGRGFAPLKFPLLSTLGEVRFFSNDILTNYEETFMAMQRLQQRYPDKVTFSNSSCFIHRGTTAFRSMSVGANYWKTAYTSRPLSILWILFDANCERDCFPQQVLDKLATQESFQQVYASTAEKTRIIAVEIPANYRFVD